jgi:hypothetical protein
MKEEIQAATQLLWQVRSMLEEEGSKWRTPNNLRSLRHARVELAELDDALLRQEMPSEARNNAAKDTVDDEAADSLMMLLTALDGSQIPAALTQIPIRADVISDLFDVVNMAVMTAGDDRLSKYYTARAVVILATAFPEATSRVAMRLARIVKKHGCPPVDDQKWVKVFGSVW